MIEIKAPNNIAYDGRTTLFISGGITGTVSNWQKDFINKFVDDDVVIYNPRREGYDKYEEGVEYQQIKWEYDNMRAVDIIVMWFPKEAPCVITLHELGRILERINITGVHLVIGIEKGYKREADVRIQTKLSDINGNVKIVDNLYDLEQETRKLL